MYNSSDIARYFVQKSRATEKIITSMKLHKLCYISYGFYLAAYDKKLFNDRIEAWKYGPVIPDLYQVTKFESRNVSLQLLNVFAVYEKIVHKDILETLDVVWGIYNRFSAIELSKLTHMKDTPWDKSFNGEQCIQIPDSVIKEYYVKLIEELPKNQ